MGIIVLVCCMVLWREGSFSSENEGDSVAAQSLVASGEENAARFDKARLRDSLAPLVMIGDDGLRLRLALDEVVLRDGDGKDHLRRLDPLATFMDFKKRLADFPAVEGVLPVVYVEGEERNEGSRRLVTTGIRARLSMEMAEALARSHNLRIREFPGYAPGWVIFDAEAPLDALEKVSALRASEAVESADVLLAVQYDKKLMPNDPLLGQQWHLKASGAALVGTDINVEGVWRFGETGGLRGSGVRIGIVDDGVQTGHPDFVGNIDTVNGFDWNGNDSDPNPGTGDDHGTACAGIAAARGNNALGVSGVAPEARIVGMRLLGGSVTDAQVAQTVNYLPNVIEIRSNSWGPADTGKTLSGAGPLTREAFVTATNEGRNGKGSIFVWAAGNGGRPSANDNSNYDSYANSIYTIAVGATDSLGRRADYSEPGANVVICAPSSGASPALRITTTDRTGADGFNTIGGTAGNYTSIFGGTSASTPAIAGVVALLLEENPDLGWRDVQEILIRSAKKVSPSDADWGTNQAGIDFNHNFGAGLVDAEAAVELAGDWENLAMQEVVTSTQPNLGVLIPDDDAVGISRQFSIPASNLRCEHVTLRLSISHTARGNLEISLTSPSGMVSRLAEVRNDTNANYTNWTFSSVRHWGEMSSGTWTLRIADRSSNGNSSGGTLTFAELKVFGTEAGPVNPVPVVAITSPENGAVISPGLTTTFAVDAVDFTIGGQPGVIEEVNFFRDDVLVGSDHTAPYSFDLELSEGVHVLHAKATDSEGGTGISAPVLVEVRNQTPVINGLVLSVTGQGFSDVPLSVVMVDVFDAEGDSVTLSYQWQFSQDGEIFTDLKGAGAATLAPSPLRSGKSWRCVITASDGNTVSEPFMSEAVNLLDRPSVLAQPGDLYSYQSGLVLKGDTLRIDRQAIIHEFSQGTTGGTSEWIEILTLESGSLRYWDIRDEAENLLVFQDTPVWGNIPAGTLIVIYNGNDVKDPRLPPDSSDPASGKMILSSTNTTYFDPDFSEWPVLGNSGDSIFLVDDENETIHEIAYGNSIAASPNIGNVSSSQAAFYAGNTDAGASSASEWIVTTAAVARDFSEDDGAVSGRALNPNAVLTNGGYQQNFNTIPGPTGTAFPNGWTAFNQANLSTVEAPVMTLDGGGALNPGVYNFGSRIGLRGGSGSFDPSFLALALHNTAGLTGLRISYDIEKIIEAGRSMQFELQYAEAGVANTSTAWISIAGTNHFSGSTSAGTVTKYSDVPLPPVFSNRQTPIYLRWYYRTSPSNGGAGGHDALAIDNVLITSDQSPSVFLALTLDTDMIPEDGGTALGTVTLNSALATSLTVSLSSSDTSEATVPESVVIPAGQLSATFLISAVDDGVPDGPQVVAITASASNAQSATSNLTVTDEDPALIGVTPGAVNSEPNGIFIERLRAGQLNDPALFRLAAGISLPPGLALDALGGLISGTISPGVEIGSYPITIERTNSFGELVSQSFILQVGGFTYGSWTGSFPSLLDSAPTADPDKDGLPNLIEYAMGTHPSEVDFPSPLVFEKGETSISVTYQEGRERPDVSLVAEWSESLEADSWETAGIMIEELEEHADHRVMRASLVIEPGQARRFIRLRATLLGG